ncbi:MAG: hypothetical protein F7B20_00305 [Aeropyrum sp.]|nr:hypothetical protein [Aeropyrum sp.]MCE4615966.1 hypothetical protein [Aeropyrum sp.]
MSARRIDDYFRREPRKDRVEMEMVREAIEDLGERLARLEARLDEIEGLLRHISRELGKLGVRGYRKSSGSDDAALGVIERSGYILASESRQKAGLPPAALISLARDYGLPQLDVGGDIAVFTRESYEEFLDMLEKVRSSDPEEAASELGRYGRVFLLLRKKGSVYYDSKSGLWRILE